MFDNLTSFLVLSTYPKIVQLVLVLVINFVLYKLAKFLIKKIIKGYSKKKSSNKGDTLITVLTSVSKYMVYFICFCQILSVFGVSVTSILAVAGASSVVIGFGAQSLVKDIIAGIFILLEDQFSVGDIVTLEGRTGTVEALGIRITRIRDFDGNVHIIPNGEIKIVTNMSKEFKSAVIEVAVSYEENIDKVLAVLRDEMEAAGKVISQLKETPVVLGVTSFGDSTVSVRIIAKCDILENWAVERELRRLIKNRFETEGFKYPYKKMIIEGGN